MSLRFRIEPMPHIDLLGDMWRELEGRADHSFFLSWVWIASWIEESGAAPVVLVGEAEGQVVLLGLLVPGRQGRVAPFAVNALRLHETGDSRQDVITIEYNGFLVDQQWSARAEREAVSFLLGETLPDGRSCDELHLRGVPQSGAVLADAPLQQSIVSRQRSWRVDLDAIRASGRPYLAHLSANTRQQISRSMRLYEARGELRLDRARDGAEARAFLDGLKRLHQATWTARGEKGAFAYPFFERFHRRIIDAGFAGGAVELVRVSCGAEPVGYLYNLLHRGQVYAYQSGLRYTDDARLKPGLVTHSLCVQRHVTEGARVYDFMAGDARYKASLGQPGPDMVYVVVHRPTTLRLLRRGLRTLSRRLGIGAPAARPVG